MEQIFLKLLNMSITAGYCALAVMILRLLLKKQPKIYSYALWLIVAFRLLCPVSFESIFSLMRVSTETIPSNIAMQKAPEVSTGIGSVDVVVNRVLNTVAAPAPGDSVNPLQVWLFVGSVLWLVVAAGFLGYGIGSYLKMRQELKGAEETEPGVFVSERLKTPFVMGFLHPVIYLPEGLSGAERAYVLEHERTHIGRRDPIVKLGAFLLMCIHWFNPVLWLSFFLMCKDMEMSCDEKVIKTLSENHSVETKKDYASTLLSLASNHQFSFGGPLAFGEGNIKKRIANVLQYKKRTVAVSAVLAAVVLAVIFLFVGNPKTEKEIGGVPEVQATPLATPEITPLPVTGAVVATFQMELLKEENGVRHYYGIIEKTRTETGYFTLDVPEECVGEICYYLKLAEQAEESFAVQEIRFYLTKQLSAGGLKKWLEDNGDGPQMVQELDAYRWIELKPFLEEGNIKDFVSMRGNLAVINEAGTGGYLHEFPLDNILMPGTEEYAAYDTAGRSFDINTQLTIHLAPQTVYTAQELAAYALWMEESLGTKLQENVYYGELKDNRTVTPYFELWIWDNCVDKVSYLLRLEEKEDGTRAVSYLNFYYTPGTHLKPEAAVAANDNSDYFTKASWLGGVWYHTLEEYLYDAAEKTLLRWAERAGSIHIRDIEPYYLAEAAPVGRELYWTNAEGTGGYFVRRPSDVQWREEFKEEYLTVQGALMENLDITFFGEPEADISPELMQKLKESAGLE